MTNSTISGNTPLGSGGGIFNSGTLAVISSTKSGNAAFDYRGLGSGGGIANIDFLNFARAGAPAAITLGGAAV
ncbi:hypothetical protein V5E97_08140 [Singulisphaera sp. Ch08]|uniref:Uncharacterized protein n=1 Tax=Singulisphaera sp. Ch08 TaxID=3120278 RepID=A0AAU7CKQ7_9BACT